MKLFFIIVFSFALMVSAFAVTENRPRVKLKEKHWKKLLKLCKERKYSHTEECDEKVKAIKKGDLELSCLEYYDLIEDRSLYIPRDLKPFVYTPVINFIGLPYYHIAAKSYSYNNQLVVAFNRNESLKEEIVYLNEISSSGIVLMLDFKNKFMDGFKSGYFCRNFPKVINKKHFRRYILDGVGQNNGVQFDNQGFVSDRDKLIRKLEERYESMEN